MTDYDPRWAIVLSALAAFIVEIDSHEQDSQHCDRLFSKVWEALEDDVTRLKLEHGDKTLTLFIEKYER